MVGDKCAKYCAKNRFVMFGRKLKKRLTDFDEKLTQRGPFNFQQIFIIQFSKISNSTFRYY
jgi:hypothetical protein